MLSYSLMTLPCFLLSKKPEETANNLNNDLKETNGLSSRA